jgi:hypothetical protein
MMMSMSRDLVRAPRWRSTLAGLVDAALLAGVAWAFRGRVRDPAGSRALALLGSAGEFAREQLASPGQRLLGVRTVDRRTGRRIQLWRTGLLLGASVAGQQLTARLRPAALQEDPAREGFLTELREIHERHPVDSPELAAERHALYQRHTVSLHGPDLMRAVGVSTAVALLNRRLRRRVAPTVEVLARRR